MLPVRVYFERRPVVVIALISLALAFVGVRSGYHVFGSNTIGSRAIAKPQSDEATAHTLYCGLWRTDGNFVSTANIKNVLTTTDLTLSPIVYMADGTSYDLPPLNLAPGGIASIDVNEALNNAPVSIRAHLSEIGSMALRFNSRSSFNVSAGMQMLNVPASLIFVAPFQAKMNSTHHMQHSQQVLDAIWWKHDSGVRAFVAISNASDSSKTILLEVIGLKGAVQDRTVTLDPKNTEMFDIEPQILALPEDERTMGGVRVKYEGRMQDARATAGLVNDSEGYSATSEFEPHLGSQSSPTSISYASVGMMVGAPDPMMKFPSNTSFTPYAFIRNSTSSPLDAKPVLYLMSGNQMSTAALPVQHLAPNESRQLPLSSVLSNLNGMATLVVSYVGSSHDLLVSTGSVDQTATFVFQVPPDTAAESWAKDDPYWSVADGFDSMMTVFNSGNVPEDLVATFSYVGGTGRYAVPLHLAAGESSMLDVGQLIEMNQPDSDGNLIPPGVQRGSVRFASTDGPDESVHIALGTGIFSVKTATCGQGNCNICLTTTDTKINPAPVITAIGGSQQASFVLTMSDGSTSNKSSTAHWTSGNTSIATVSAGLVRGVAVGTSTISATVEGPGNSDEPPPECPSSCPMGLESGSGGDTVTPTVSFNPNSPAFVLVGVDPSITVFNLQQVVVNPAGGMVGWTGIPTGLSFSPNNTASADVTTITASSGSVTVNDTTLNVTYTVNGVAAKSPATKAITKSKFAFLTGPTMVPVPIGSGNFGYAFNETYTIFTDPGMNQLLPGYSGIPVPESVILKSGGIAGVEHTSTGSTNANSQFVDFLAVISNQAIPSGANEVDSQLISVSTFPVRTNTLTFSSTTVTVMSNGPSQ